MENFNSASQANIQSNLQSNLVPFKLERSEVYYQVSDQASDQATRLDEQESFWSRFWDGLYRWLMTSSEPQIARKRKQNGDEYYQVYDPISGRSIRFGSEQETRIWLDRRFYQ